MRKDMKEIPLANYNLKAKVDDEDYDWLMKYEWFYLDGYAVTMIDGEIYYMHNMIAANMFTHAS
jgi:hypothetical protein